MIKILRGMLVLAVTVALSACGAGDKADNKAGAKMARASVELLGAGASFPAPLVTAWADEYRELSKGAVSINYQSIGSGGGVRQFMEQTIMFGASEAFLSDENMELVKTNTAGIAYNLPITLGDVVLTYNLPSVKERLVFNADTIAGAFLGEITRWDDAKIAALNPGVKLPSLPIKIAHRSDGSGTTNVFANYLTKVNKTWADKIGFGSSINWPVGNGGNGNEGVAGIVQNTPGALGYNSLVYAVLNKIAYGKVINSAGNTIDPSLQSTSLAAAVTIPEDGRIMVTNTEAAQGYPIAGFSWILVYENLEKNKAIGSRDQAAELVRFLYWIVTEGQNTNEGLSFARLPSDAQAIAERMISTLKYQGEALGQLVIADIKANGY